MLYFIGYSPFRRDDKKYSRSVTVTLRSPTADTAAPGAGVVHGAKAIVKPGSSYAKAGVMLLYLQDASVVQQELALDEGRPGLSALMETIDRLNERYRRGSIAVASTGKSNGQRSWTMETVIEDAGVHDAVGGCAAGVGVTFRPTPVPAWVTTSRSSATLNCADARLH